MMALPRILQVGKYYAPHKGGIETHLQLLCEQLRGHADVRVVVASGTRSSSEETVGGVPVKRLATWLNLASAPLCPAMVREIRDSQADIVHLHLPNPSAVMAYLASGHTGTLICSYHSDTVRQKILGPAFEPILMQVLRRSAAVIAASPNYIESSRVLRAVRDRCRVIPYGIPVAQFDRVDSQQVDAIQRQYGPNLLVTVGRFVYYKGFEYLIRAMEKIDGRLLLVGDGPLRPVFEKEIRARGLENRVTLLGQVEDILPFYQAAEIFVLPSIARSEAFGIVQLEAMACGKPVVNTQLDSGVNFVSLDGVTGITVAPQDPAALATAINTLLGNADLRARYGAAARSRVQQLFTLETMTKKMLELYDQVCPSFSRTAALASRGPR